MIKKLLLSLCVLLISTMICTPVSAATAADGAEMPVFTPNGRITCGTKSIWQKPDYGSLILCIDNDAIGSMYEMFNFGKGELHSVFFLNPKTTTTGNHSTYTAEARDSTASNVILGNYSLDLSLREDGLVKIEAICALNNPAVQTNRYAVIDLPPYLKLTGRYVKGDKTINFDAKSAVTFSNEDLNGATLSFFPDNADRSFSIQPISCAEITINGSRITFRADNKNVLSLLMDLRSKETGPRGAANLSPNGIDFWSIDRLRLPDYGASANLIVNPSFEAGFRYWGFPIYVGSAIPLKYRDLFELDDTVAHSGSRSLRIKTIPLRAPSSLGPFAIPFIPGEKYTYSFYAKGSSDKGQVLHVWGRGMVSQLFPENVLTFEVGREWKRYSIPFVAKERFSSIFIDAKSTDGTEDGHVWVDDVQLEKGDMTDFKAPPVSAELVSAARGNFLEFGQKPDFKLNIHSSAPNATGNVSITVEDYFFNTIFEKTYPFKTDARNNGTVALDDLSALVLNKKLRGVPVVAAVFNIDGVERPYKDFFRFSVMNFLENKQKNKNMFNLTYVYSHQAGGPHYERSLARERAIGFGSICYDFIAFANDLDYNLDRERVELAERYGFDFMGRPVLKLHDGVDGEISEQNGKVVMQGIKNLINPTDAELAKFEEICALKAKNRPWNKIWWFTGESNPGAMPLESHHDAFAKFLLATCRGIKRGNPNAKVLIEGGPWTIDPQYGAKWVERYIQDTRRIDPTVKFDGAAAHHYRNFPENPDLDSDIAAFLAMLDRNGCKDWPLYINEGGNYVPFNIPQEGISPYIMHSGNSWYIGPLSYDYGRAERITAAFSARNWLIGLKYASRVACMQDFDTPNRTVDYDFTSRPYEKIPNTLGRILGNASFYKDVRFAPDARCYIFIDDNTKAPVAALWGYKEGVDRWKEEAPLYAFDFGRQDLKFVNLMENEVTFPKDAAGRTMIPASPFPIFIEGAPGTEKQLLDAIAHAAASNNSVSTVDISAYPDADGKATIVFANKVSNEFTGDAKIVLNQAESHLSLQLKPLERMEKRIPLPAGLHGKLLPFNADISLDGGISMHISNPYMLLKNNGHPKLTVDSTLAAWREIPAVSLDGGLSLRFALSGTNVMVAIETKDHNNADGKPFAGTGLYCDPFGALDQWTAPKLVNQDVAAFEFIKTDKGIEAMCHNVQGTQGGSGNKYLVAGQVQKHIAVKVSADAKGQMMIFSIPQEVLAPLILKPGSRFGINLVFPTSSSHTVSLAPVSEFKNAAKPGDIHFVTVIVSN
ncbi:MAG: hypothetical protein IT447_07430 [Phycisphaerales bacterium]|jgi:hypothetical protein|nr:hypothetical protein [Phycisphaerales bacterium]